MKNLLILFIFSLITLPSHSFAIDPYNLRYHSSITFASNVHDKLEGPVSILVDNDAEEIIVVDTKRNEVLIYNFESVLIDSFGKSKGINFPLDIAISGSNYLITEENSHYVSLLSFNGNKISEITPPVEMFIDFEPKKIVVDDDGFIYVTDLVLKKCFVFDKNFKFVRTIGENLRSITDVAVHGDSVYLLDSIGPNSILIYSKTGEFQVAFEAQAGRGGTLNIPLSLKVDSFANIWIIDAMAGIIVYDKNFNNIARLTKNPSRGVNFISYPVDIDFGVGNSVYIIDRTTKSVKIFK